MKQIGIRRTELCSLLTAMTAGLAACGGGGDSTGSSSSSTPTESSVSVTPAMGAFSAGAIVNLYKPDGTPLGSGQTNAAGKATVNAGTYAGPFIVQVRGAPGVTAFNEKTGQQEAFGAADILLAAVPGMETATGASVGVTPLTHAAAVQVVSNLVTPRVAGTPAEATEAIAQAIARIQVAIGVDPASFDILTEPDALADITDRLSTETAPPEAARYGAYLAALAIASNAPSQKEKVRLLAEDAAADGQIEQHGALVRDAVEALLTVRDTYTSGAAFAADLSAQVSAMRAAQSSQSQNGSQQQPGQSQGGTQQQPGQSQGGSQQQPGQSQGGTQQQASTDSAQTTFTARYGVVGRP